MNIYKSIIIIIIAVFMGSCGESTGIPAKIEEPVKPKKTTPELTAVYKKFSDMEHFFEPQNDTTYVINFWATWCAPCIEELPYFEYMNKTYLDEKLKVVLVSLDFEKQIEKKLKPFIQREKLMSEVVALTDGDYSTWIDKVNPHWDGAIPATFFVRGDQQQFYFGVFESYNDLESIVKSFLKNKKTKS